MTPSMKAIDAAAAAKARVVVLFVDRSRVGTQRSIGGDRVETTAEKDRVSAVVRLFKRGTLTKANRVMNDAVDFCRRTCIAAPRPGMYVCPIGLVERVDEKMRAFEVELLGIVEEITEGWDRIVSESVEALGDLGDRAAYPSAETVRQSMSLRHSFVTFDTPDATQLGVGVFEAQQRQAREEWDELRQNGMAIIRTQFEELVVGIERAVSTTEDGRKRTFRETRRGSSLSKLTEFIETLASRDISGDEELAGLVARSRAIIEGVDVPALRKDDATRAYVGQMMATVGAEAKALVKKRPRRAISFEEDE